MLNFSQIAIRRGTRLLFSKAVFTIQPGERAGIVGPNGCGKSSLFQLILGQLESDDGEWSVAGNPVVAHVAQELAYDERNAIEHVLDGDVEYRHLLDRLNEADGAAQQRFEEIDGYGAPARAARLLSGLGFAEERMQLSANTLSGGWRMRINLARALMCRSDLLLLDEPTNHLDLDAVIWLEQWLIKYQGTLLLISHDRDFLDGVINRVISIERQQVTEYTGNYSDFEKIRGIKLGQQQAAYQKQQREIGHMQSFVTRFRAKASKAKQAQSRLKALERMEQIAPAHVDSPFNFQFQKPDELPEPLIKLRGAEVGYPGVKVLSNVTMTIAPGERIGLLGLNGAGKSTLSRLLSAELMPTDGLVETAKHLRCGYFAQEQLELLTTGDTPAEHFQQQFALHDEQKLRNFLGGFGFSGDRVFEKVGHFSGGEKARVVLAMVVYAKPNLLIMDEPTNHLDIDMRHALTVALQSFEGAVVLVSHDRHLLRATTDQLLLVDQGKVMPFDDDLDDYPRWLSDRKKNKSGQSVSRNVQKDMRKIKAQLRQQLQPLRNKVRKCEQMLEKLVDKNTAIEEQLADNDLYNEENRSKLTDLVYKQANSKKAIEEAEMELLEFMEAAELAEEELRKIDA